MKHGCHFLAVALLALGGTTLSATASSLLFSELHDYGIGKFNPGGDDALTADAVVVTDESNVGSDDTDPTTARFRDTFVFGTGLGPIDRIDLTLTFEGAGPNCAFGLGLCGEVWVTVIPGSNLTLGSNDFTGRLDDSLSPQTFSLSAASDTGPNGAFATAVANGLLEVLFLETFEEGETFSLLSAQADVYGSPLAAIPLPAAGWLLLGGLTGLVALGRRRKLTT